MERDRGNRRNVASIAVAVGLSACAHGASQTHATAPRATIRQPVTPLAALPSQDVGFVAVRYPPAPNDRPFTAARGLARYGYPTRAADRAALIAALFERRFSTLTRWMEAYQQDFAEDFRHEESAVGSVMAFRSIDPRLAPLLEEWLAATPNSWAPYAARAAHLVARAESMQAGCRINELSSATQRDVRAVIAAAEDAITIGLGRDSALLALRLLRLTTAISTEEHTAVSALYADSRAACEHCFQPHWAYSAVFDWLGDPSKLDRFARGPWNTAENPRLVVLSSIALSNACGESRVRGELERAVAACTDALRIGESTAAYEERGQALMLRGESERALADLRASLAIRPQVPRVLSLLELALRETEHVEEGAAVVLSLIRLSPAGIDRLRARDWWQQRLAFAMRQTSDPQVQQRLRAANDQLEEPTREQTQR